MMTHGVRHLSIGSDDRRIALLAIPALGALAAEPLYVLVDTAIVGHLGVRPLAALAGPVITVMGGRGEVGRLAVLYMRIAALGLPFALVAIAGEGYLRGVSRLRLPLVILLAGNVLNALLEVLFVYGLELGIAGSAWATVIAQSVMAAGFVAVAVPGNALRWRPDWVQIWPIFAVMQPINAIVFALDGILIGAGDTRYLMWAMLPCSLLAFTPVAIASLSLGWGIVGVWIAILVFILARLVACGLRFKSDGWAIAGVNVEQGRVDRRRSRVLQHQGGDTGPL
jgi:Na+-driven multidrug efflux pump